MVFGISYIGNFGITVNKRTEMGEAIKQARKRLNLTQKKIAENINIPATTLSKIENGHFSGSLDILERYLDAVGLELVVTEKKRRLPDWDELDELFGED